LKPEIIVPEDVRLRAKVPLDRMLEMAANASPVAVKGD
jgi:quinolinate synthase